MRTEQEMMDLILRVAREDERIRAVYMNGSRTNLKAPRDRFQDFDIVYLVRETGSFLADPGWIDVFGERLILQCPDEMDRLLGEKMDFTQKFTYLMQFSDGNRIDLRIATWDFVREDYPADTLVMPLLDKDGVLPPVPPPSDRLYWVQKPTQDQFFCCCNEFWWVSLYAAKGLWRRELLYVLDHLNLYIRPQLLRLLSWQAGESRGYTISVGKCCKYLDRYLPEESWRRLLKTYPAAVHDEMWKALMETCRLFDDTAVKLAAGFGYPYDTAEARRCMDYLGQVRSDCSWHGDFPLDK